MDSIAAAIFLLEEEEGNASRNIEAISKIDSLWGFFDPSCFVVEDLTCPNKNITFWLYTKETRDAPLQLDPLHLNSSQFKPRRPVKILIHGYTGHRNSEPSNSIRPAFLKYKDYYIISMDYGPLVKNPCYTSAVQNIPVTSKCLAQLINNLVEQKIVENKDIHLIGFSLGAHVAGQATTYINERLQWITGLDPAWPLFMTVSSSETLDETDAQFVDIIHTDVLVFAVTNAVGHIDFYPNFGFSQPGCNESNDSLLCNHIRAPQYYAESIYSDKGFWGYYCSSWFTYSIGLCYPDEQQEIMGFHINKSARGSYFLVTAEKPPFALGRNPY